MCAGHERRGFLTLVVLVLLVHFQEGASDRNYNARKRDRAVILQAELDTYERQGEAHDSMKRVKELVLAAITQRGGTYVSKATGRCSAENDVDNAKIIVIEAKNNTRQECQDLCYFFQTWPWSDPNGLSNFGCQGYAWHPGSQSDDHCWIYPKKGSLSITAVDAALNKFVQQPIAIHRDGDHVHKETILLKSQSGADISSEDTWDQPELTKQDGESGYTCYKL